MTLNNGGSGHKGIRSHSADEDAAFGGIATHTVAQQYLMGIKSQADREIALAHRNSSRGICSNPDCGQKILEERIQALGYSPRFCLACQEKIEKGELSEPDILDAQFQRASARGP